MKRQTRNGAQAAEKEVKQAPKMRAPKKAAAKAVTIDYPREEELVLSSEYTFRIDAPGMAVVEVQIDDGDWQACREAVGYWWFDWKPTPGQHELTARAKKTGGRLAKSDLRRFRVELI